MSATVGTWMTQFDGSDSEERAPSTSKMPDALCRTEAPQSRAQFGLSLLGSRLAYVAKQRDHG
jgi:hypothetical protein